MSLYIGNLSSRIHRDDLERVFQRFGRCEVRMKDGYGFVVYEFRPNAEKALRALQKSYICGEPLTLTWSNKQPRRFRRFARADRSYERHRSRDSARGRDYGKQKLGLNERQDHKMVITQQDNGGRISSGDMFDEETAYHEHAIKDYAREEHRDRKDFQDGGDWDEPGLVDRDRWGEQFHDPPNENGAENQREFDRYEPNQGYDGKIDDEYPQTAYFGDSPAPQSSQEMTGRDCLSEEMSRPPHDNKFQGACYTCGGIGHKMGNCPKGNTSGRRFSKSDSRYDDFIDRRDRGKGESVRNTITKGKLRNDMNSTGSGNHRELMRGGSSPSPKQADRALGLEYGGQKLSRRESGSPITHKTKKSRKSVSSPVDSDYKASRSQSTSQSSKRVSRSRPHAKSRSVSPRSHSLSSNLRLKSASHYSRSKSPKSRSRSSSSTSLSLSESGGQPLPSYSCKGQLNMKGSSDNVTTLESKEVLFEPGRLLGGDTVSENANVNNQMEEANIENPLTSSKGNNELEDRSLEKEIPGNKIASMSLCEVTNPSMPLAEKGKITSGIICPESLVETKGNQNSDAIMTEHVPISVKKSESEVPLSSSSGYSTKISSQELQMVLKHYGLNLQDKSEQHLPVESYFGSARLWPWEIIYYRRLKKGPISIENYTRRVDQNREFGITDRYIRSSSGWGELGQENL